MSKRPIPAYRHHQARNGAVVSLNGKNHYLGMWQSPASRQKYDALIKQWLANGRTLAEPTEDVMTARVRRWLRLSDGKTGPMQNRNHGSRSPAKTQPER